MIFNSLEIFNAKLILCYIFVNIKVNFGFLLQKKYTTEGKLVKLVLEICYRHCQACDRQICMGEYNGNNTNKR